VEIETQFRMAIRDAVNRRSRKPFYWGGLKGYQQLEAISQALHQLKETGGDFWQRLIRQVDRVVARNRLLATELEKTHGWFLQIAVCLRYPPSSYEVGKVTGQQVAEEMKTLLDAFALEAKNRRVPMALYGGLCGRWRLFGQDLLPCYDIPGLPPDNLQLESLFGRLRCHQRRISGRKSTKELRDFGQYQVLFMAESEEQLLEQLRRVRLCDYQEHRNRLAQAEAPRIFLHRLHRDAGKTMASLAARYTERQAELAQDIALEPASTHTN